MSSIKPTLNVPNHSRRSIPRKRELLIPKPARELKRMRDLGWIKSWSVSSLSLDDKRATATISLSISLGSCESGWSDFHPPSMAIGPQAPGTHGWHKWHRALIMARSIFKCTRHSPRAWKPLVMVGWKWHACADHTETIKQNWPHS